MKEVTGKLSETFWISLTNHNDDNVSLLFTRKDLYIKDSFKMEERSSPMIDNERWIRMFLSEDLIDLWNVKTEAFVGIDREDLLFVVFLSMIDTSKFAKIESSSSFPLYICVYNIIQLLSIKAIAFRKIAIRL